MGSYFECNSADVMFDGAADVVKRERQHLDGWRGRSPVNGLALSGGGIRSASYCLGALQAFAHEDCLPGFDYLSTVSGGGYIGASLSYLLNPPEGPGRDMPRFDASRKRFPYLSYPMVGAPMATPEEREVERWKGRLLRRLRQNTRYLTPGGGINLLSLAGVFLRNCLASVLVHGALIVLMLQVLISVGLFKVPDAVKSGGASPDASGDYRVLALAALFFLAYLLVSLLYVLLTAIFDPIEGQWPDAPYRLRRFNDITTFVLLACALGACVVGLVPVVHDLIQRRAEWVPGLEDLKESATIITGAVSGVCGAIGMAWGLVQARGAGKPKIPPAIVVPVAAFLLLFGVVLLAYDALAAFQPDYRLVLAGALLVILVFGWLPDLNYVSLHRYYRDRLMELFMPDPAKVWASVQQDEVQGRSERISASVAGDGALLGKLCGADPALRGDDAANRAQRAHEKLLRGPYHLINANVVLVASKHPRYHARGGDSYILSPLFSGSRAT
ncbi:MAG TPA: patatin-like phospholipase family protein, partial [Usitatibacter sp.]|nr:patatin-like phospholipase family protein [Usitatibacter sp.]